MYRNTLIEFQYKAKRKTIVEIREGSKEGLALGICELTKTQGEYGKTSCQLTNEPGHKAIYFTLTQTAKAQLAVDSFRFWKLNLQ